MSVEGITRIALERSTPGTEGARHIGASLPRYSETNVQELIAAILSGMVSMTEIDFGATPVPEKSFTVTDARVATTSHVTGSVAFEAPTGKDLDEVEMDPISLSFAPGNGQLSVFARGLEGRVYGKFKINYVVGG